jgi:hypothetical protein
MFHFGGYYLIIFEKATLSDLKTIFKTLWDKYIHNVNVLTERNGHISVLTFVPFSELGCNKTDPIKFAEFTNGSFTYRPQTFFPDKFKSLHQCSFKVSTFESLAPSVLKQDFANGSFRLYGRDISVINALSEELKFNFETFYVTPYGGWGILYSNGSATGAMGCAIRRESDFIIGNIFLKYDRSKFMDYSYVYFVDQLVLMIPPGKAFTSFEKLIRPFEILVWVFVGGTTLIGFVIITFLQFQSKALKEFVYGEGVRNPYLNIIIAMFGGSQHRLPSRNFSRSLLMLFILFCLVIR